MNFKLKELDAEWKLWLQEDWGDHSLKLESSAADTENIFETYWHLSPGRKPRELIFSSKRKRGKAKRIWYCEIYFAIRGLWNDSDIVFFITMKRYELTLWKWKETNYKMYLYDHSYEIMVLLLYFDDNESRRWHIEEQKTRIVTSCILQNHSYKKILTFCSGF